ncbi:MAG: acyltransferase [Phycisphaerales bacterium]|nr:MAG: acyltransferase [Phycisphaerales bacterium]
MSGERRGKLIPADPSPRVRRGFAWYSRRLVRKSFYALRIARETESLARDLNRDRAPVLIAMSHASWWDPIIGLLLHEAYLPDRNACAPMDAEQLERFRFMRKLGIFGINPDDPASLDAMQSYVDQWFHANDRPAIWITPQGRFTDVREPIRLRPGAAALAASHPEAKVLTVAAEYTFWQDQKPEIFVRFARCESERDTTPGWHRALTETMQECQSRLAELVMQRDPRQFTSLIGGETARINPIYDWWLRLRGKSGGIEARRPTHAASTSEKRPSSRLREREKESIS